MTHPYPLRYTLPLGALMLGLLVVLGSWALGDHDLQAASDALMRERVLALGDFVLPVLQAELAAAHPQAGVDLMARIRCVPQLRLGLLCDDDGRILAATDAALRGRRTREAGAWIDPLLAQVRRQPARRLETSADGRTLQAVFPTANLGARHWLVTESDIAAQQARLQGDQFRHLGILFSTSLLASVLVGFYFNRTITRRAAALAKGAQSFAAGQLDARPQLAGSDELAQIGAAFNHMAGLLQAHATELRESEERFRHLADSAPVLIWIVQADGAGIYFNQSWHNFTGRTLEQELGSGWTDGLHPEDRAACTGDFHDRIAAQVAYTKEFRLRRHDGEYRWLYTSAVPRWQPDGQFAGFIGTCVDLTEVRETHEALRRSEAHQTAILESAQDCIITIDHEGRILEFNAAAELAFGRSRDQVRGRPLVEVVIPAGSRRSYQQILAQYASAGAADPPARRTHGTALRADGTIFPVEFTVTRLPGEPPRFTAFVRDLTEQQLAEAAVQQLAAEQQAILETLTVGVSLVRNRRIAWANRAHDELFGHEVGRSPGLPTSELYARPGEHDRVGREGYEAIRAAGHYVTSAEMKRVDGTPFQAKLIGHRLRGTPKEDGTIWIVEDISERMRADAAVRESELRYRAMFDTNQAIKLLIDPATGEIVKANSAACDFYGYAPEQIIRLRIMDINALDAEAVRREMALAEREERQYFNFQHRLASGEIRDVEVHSSPVHSSGRALLFSIVHDVTARRQAEAQLRKLSRAVEQSPVTIVITDCAGAIEYVNPSFTEKTGYTFDEVRGANPRILSSGEQSAERYREMWSAITSGREWRGVFHNRRKDGELFWEAATVSPLFDDAGQITHFLAVKEDISNRKEAQDRIREQAALLDATLDAIIVLNLERVITFWNRGAEKLYGLSRERAVGQRYESVAYRDKPVDFEPEWQKFLQDGEWTFERRQVSGERGEIPVQTRATLVRNEQGQVASVLLITTDITEAKRLESQFLRAQRLESLGALASGVAHDLNNVLTPILLAGELLTDLARTPAEKELIQQLSLSARRGADIVQQLLLYGRGSDSPRSPLNLGRVMKETEQMIRGTFPKNLVVTFRVPKDLWTIDGDRTQLHQVLLNLCVNARDAMPLGGKLTVGAENITVDAAFAARQPGAKPGPHLLVRVRDNGTGIPLELLDKIFDPFFTTKALGQGTGLGLATVLGIVRSHGGFITVDSIEKVGSEFAVYLPARAESLKLSDLDQHRPRLQGRGELILVIDDEENIRSTLSRVLADYGYRAITAADGAQGLAAYVRHAAEIKLVITDHMMPVMDGAQAIWALRQLNPRLPVVIVSGISSQRAELEANFGPHLRFLSKPFLIEKVLSHLRELLEAPVAPVR